MASRGKRSERQVARRAATETAWYPSVVTSEIPPTVYVDAWGTRQPTNAEEALIGIEPFIGLTADERLQFLNRYLECLADVPCDVEQREREREEFVQCWRDPLHNQKRAPSAPSK